MKILVTGAAGFIGSNFVRHWVNEHPDDGVVALDLLTYAGNRDNLADVDERITFVEGDIGDLDLVTALLEREDIDVIVNFAAESHNSLAVLDPPRFLRTNVLGTQTLLEAARERGVERFHHISTCEVYGDLALDDPGSFTEDSPYRPRTPVQRVEGVGRSLRPRVPRDLRRADHDLELLEQLRARTSFPRRCVPFFTTLALDDKPLPLYASTDHKREWLHVLDHCRAVEQIVLRGRNGETYNVGSNREATIDEIADLVLDTLGKPDSLKTIVPDRPGHDRRYLLDCDEVAARARVGTARSSSSRGMRATVEWYAANRAWWEPLLDRAPVVETAWSAGPASAPLARVRVLVTGAGGQVGARVVECLGAPRGARRRSRRPRPRRSRSGASRWSPRSARSGGQRRRDDQRRPVRTRSGSARSRSMRSACATSRSRAERVGAHVVHISTDYVFDGESTRPYDEWDAVAPISEYGRSKLGGERELVAHVGSWAIVRTSWVFGKRGSDLISWAFGAYERGELDGVLADQISTAHVRARSCRAARSVRGAPSRGPVPRHERQRVVHASRAHQRRAALPWPRRRQRRDDHRHP